MRYKVFVSDGDTPHIFYVEDRRQAELLFNMAKYSRMFSYVSLSETIDDDFMVKDWCEEDDD